MDVTVSQCETKEQNETENVQINLINSRHFSSLECRRKATLMSRKYKVEIIRMDIKSSPDGTEIRGTME